MLIVLPGYFVCAEPFYGGFLGNVINSASTTRRSLGLFGGIVSSVVDGVKSATKGILQTLFGNGYCQPAESSAAVTASVGQSSPDVTKPDGNVAETVSTASTVVTSDSSVTELVTTTSTETSAPETSSSGN